MTRLGNVISESLPESARQRVGSPKVPGAVAQTVLIQSPGQRTNTMTDYVSAHKYPPTHTHGPEMFPPTGPNIDIWTEKTQMVSAIFENIT